MAKITNFDCIFDGKKLPTDAFGNNAAFACPSCGHPVLMLTHDENQRGMSKDNPAECRNCGRKYAALSPLVNGKINLREVPATGGGARKHIE